MYSYVVKNFGGKKVWQIRSFGRTRFGKLKSIYNSLNVLHFLIQSIGSHTQNSAHSIQWRTLQHRGLSVLQEMELVLDVQ